MDRFANLPDNRQGDWGGVHTNSGIPNKAFYLAATRIGGHAWEAPGHIWYEALLASTLTTQFQDFADTTYVKAGQLYGASSPEQQAIVEAWREVGIRISGATSVGSGRGRVPGGAVPSPDSLAALARQVDALATQVKAIAKDVSALKRRK
jgi:hypothetical protein